MSLTDVTPTVRVCICVKKSAIQDEQNGTIGVYYIDQNKAAGLLQRAGLQLPSGLFRTDGYIHSIRDSDSPVKPKFENVTETKSYNVVIFLDEKRGRWYTESRGKRR